jgi:hypothetical protein
MKEILDIKYKNSGLSSELSNLYPHSFNIDGYDMASMESFLQSLKIPYIEIKKDVFKFYGYDAWQIGVHYDWRKKQELYWVETPIDRHSQEYLDLITRAYDCLFEQNEDFRISLKNSTKYTLEHTIGGTNVNETIMTRKEFIFQLNRLRNTFNKKKYFDLSNIFNF